MSFPYLRTWAPPPSPPRARASASHLPPVRKIGSIDFRLNRRTVVYEYGAGPPEVRRDSEPGVLRRGRKRDFSPYLNRGLGESHSTRVREYARKVCGPCLVDTKAGNNSDISSLSKGMIVFKKLLDNGARNLNYTRISTRWAPGAPHSRILV